MSKRIVPISILLILYWSELICYDVLPQEDCTADSITSNSLVLKWGDDHCSGEHKVDIESDPACYKCGNNSLTIDSCIATIQDLCPFENYTFHVNEGNFKCSFQTKIGGLGTAQNVEFLNISSTSVSVEWNNPNCVRAGNGTHYVLEVYYKDDDSKVITNIPKVFVKDGAERMRYLLIDLRPWTWYYVKINTADSRTHKKIDKNVPPFSTLPGEPGPPSTFLVKRVESRQITLIWAKPLQPNGPIHGYHLSCEPHQCNDWKGNATNATVEFLIPYTTYTFALSAFNIDSGKILYGEKVHLLVETLVDEPGPPSSFAAEDIESRQVTLKWKMPYKPNGPLDGYSLKCEPKPCNGFEFGKSSNSATVLNLTPYTNYTFVLRSFNKMLNRKLFGEEINLSVETSVAEPGPPASFKAEDIESRQVTLKWKMPNKPNGPIDGYSLKCKPRPCNNLELEKIHDSVTVLNLTPRTNYTFVLRSFNKLKNRKLFGEEIILSVETSADEPNVE